MKQMFEKIEKNLLAVLKNLFKWTLNMRFFYTIDIKSKNVPILIIGINKILRVYYMKVYFMATFHLCKQGSWSV
jgi:hypothetical protein